MQQKNQVVPAIVPVVVPNGWEVIVKVEDEECADLSDLGTWTSAPKGFHFRRGKWNGEQLRMDHNTHKFFQPANDPAIAQRHYHSMGYSKSQAYDMAHAEAREAWKLAESYGDTWNYKSVSVTIEVEGIAVGSASIGMVADHWDRSSAHDIEFWTAELTREALEDAQANLAKLKKVA